MEQREQELIRKLIDLTNSDKIFWKESRGSDFNCNFPLKSEFPYDGKTMKIEIYRKYLGNTWKPNINVVGKQNKEDKVIEFSVNWCNSHMLIQSFMHVGEEDTDDFILLEELYLAVRNNASKKTNKVEFIEKVFEALPK